MTRLSMTFALASLTVSLAPAAQAYGTDMEAITSDLSAPVVLIGAKQPDVDGACTVNITPILAAALGLTAPNADAAPVIQQACLAQ